MKSSMFLRNITVIDHAYIGNDGRQHGGSFHASFAVSGKVDDTEQVVIDFSRVKKDIKAIVDHNEDGFDHKLWVMSPYSQSSIKNGPGSTVTLETSALKISAPSNAFRFFDASSYNKDEIALVIGKHVEKVLGQSYPGLDIEVKCELNEDPVSTATFAGMRMFRYSHGLRNSSSWGCQNIAHGHLSFIEISPGDHWREDCEDCREGVATLLSHLEREWDGAVVIDEANIVENNESVLSISYTTPRGTFFAAYQKSVCKLKVLPHETTIEHIVEAFCRETGYWIERGHIGKVSISEGLSKGAYKEFNYV